jgi:uncharacterized membrane protein YoaK (UPF0700 family)
VFRHEGPARSETKNSVLAAYLALAGGYVNSAGFILLGTFTSHVTGNVGRLAIDIARNDVGAAWGALTMIAAFFFGAVVASAIIESAAFRSKPNAYGTALAVEAALLLVFLLLPEAPAGLHRLHDSKAAVICGAMGLQNSLVTRLSGAVVRTTHLTGVLTDLGIEVARWARWARARLSRRFGMTLVLGDAERPAVARIRLLTIITITFSTGALLGAWAASEFRYRALFVPIAGLALAAVYAVATGRTRVGSATVHPKAGG